MRPKGLKINAAGNAPELLIYDEIGPSYYGLVSGESVVRALNEIGNRRLTVRINSPGGDVFEGFAIYNALARHPAGVNVEVDALAASAASLVAMAGKKIRMAANSMMMIHNAWTIAGGNGADLRKTADLLDQVDGNLTDTYVARTKLSKAKVEQLLDDETWMTASEAVSQGFADEIGQALNAYASVPADRYRNTPRRFQDAPAPASGAEAYRTRIDDRREQLILAGVFGPDGRPRE